ncbi:BTB/POZ domain-containing protein 6-like [Amblyomma americanum]
MSLLCTKCGSHTACQYCGRKSSSYGYSSSKRYALASCQTDGPAEFSFAKFLKEEDLTDVEIAVENKDFPNQNRSFKAHRLLLALQNDVFRAMFYGNFAKEERVVITDLHPEGVLGLLRYFYSGQLEVDSVYQALFTRSAAIKYLEPELAKKCVSYVKRNIKEDDVCPVLDYVLAREEDVTDLPTRSLIEANSLTVLSSKGFDSCLEYTACYVIDHVINVPEFSVMRAIHAWALNQCLVAIRENGEEKSVRHFMQPFFSKMRFLALTAEEFVSGPNQWGALTAQEARTLLCNIIKKDSLPLPNGFCSLNCPRK